MTGSDNNAWHFLTWDPSIGAEVEQNSNLHNWYREYSSLFLRTVPVDLELPRNSRQACMYVLKYSMRLNYFLKFIFGFEMNFYLFLL